MPVPTSSRPPHNPTPPNPPPNQPISASPNPALKSTRYLRWTHKGGGIMWRAAVNNCIGCWDRMKDSLTQSQRRTTYFEKYRKDLEKISTHMSRKERPTTSYEMPVEVRDLPKQVVTNSKMTMSNTLPQRNPMKRSFVQETPKEVQPKMPMPEAKEEMDVLPRENETMKEVEALVEELDSLRAKMGKTEREVEERSRMVDDLKLQVEVELAQQPTGLLHNYAEQILMIQSRMKAKKEAHEDELHKLVAEKNTKHFENVELSKSVESYEEELQRLKDEYRKSQELESVRSLQTKGDKLREEMAKLQKECEQVTRKINNSEELKEIGAKEFKRYCEVYVRQLLGREIAQAEDRINDRNNGKRHLVDIERKKILIKQKKVEITLREKSLLEARKVIAELNKKINEFKEEMKLLNNDKKMPLFKEN